MLSLTACEKPRLRSFSEYLEDDIARDATLARCNTDRASSLDDLECKNARRAAAAIAAQAEAERRARLEAESERKRAAARERIAAQQEAARRAAEAARRAAEAAYEQQFLYGGTKLETVQPPPTDGEPMAPGVPPAVPLPATLEPGVTTSPPAATEREVPPAVPLPATLEPGATTSPPAATESEPAAQTE